LGVRIVCRAVQFLVGRGDGLSQRRHALHRRVLVPSLAHVTRDRFDQCRIAVEIRKPLRQIDRADSRGELRHHGEDGRADARQLRGEVIQNWLMTHGSRLRAAYDLWLMAQGGSSLKSRPKAGLSMSLRVKSREPISSRLLRTHRTFKHACLAILPARVPPYILAGN